MGIEGSISKILGNQLRENILDEKGKAKCLLFLLIGCKGLVIDNQWCPPEVVAYATKSASYKDQITSAILDYANQKPAANLTDDEKVKFYEKKLSFIKDDVLGKDSKVNEMLRAPRGFGLFAKTSDSSGNLAKIHKVEEGIQKEIVALQSLASPEKGNQPGLSKNSEFLETPSTDNTLHSL